MYYSWVHLHGANGRTAADMSHLHSAHHAWSILADYLTIFRHNTRASMAFMKDLVEDAGIEHSFRAAQNTLQSSSLMIDSPLYACLKLLTMQYQTAGLQNYSTFPILPAINRALGRQYDHWQIDASAKAGTLVNYRLWMIRSACQHIKCVLRSNHRVVMLLTE